MALKNKGKTLRVLIGVIARILQIVLWLSRLFSPTPLSRYTHLHRCGHIFAVIFFSRFFGSYYRGVWFSLVLLLLGNRGYMKGVIPGLSKMASKESIHIVVSGSTAGKFSCVMPGFGTSMSKSTSILSQCVTKLIAPVSSDLMSLKTFTSIEPDVYLCPRGETTVEPLGSGAPRTGNLPNYIGLLDISKPGGSNFLDRIEQRFLDLGCKVRRFTKPTFSRQCPTKLRLEMLSKCDSVVCALAD